MMSPRSSFAPISSLQTRAYSVKDFYPSAGATTLRMRTKASSSAFRALPNVSCNILIGDDRAGGPRASGDMVARFRHQAAQSRSHSSAPKLQSTRAWLDRAAGGADCPLNRTSVGAASSGGSAKTVKKTQGRRSLLDRELLRAHPE